jgi:exonuclease SbcC
MRFASIRGKGLGVSFPDEFSVDLDAVPGPLVAITGENGAGKTTFLELLGGSMYRVCPTRGSLGDLATGRDSFLETVVVNGSRHHIRHVMDSVSGKGESVVSDDAGRPLVASAKMREFDAWALKHLPAREVFYASMFAAQGSSGFVGMTPAGRKAVLLRVLGIERLEALAEKAREHVRAAKSAIAVLEGRIADERERASDPLTVELEHAALVAKHAELLTALNLAKGLLDQVTAAEQLARIAKQDVDAHMARRNEILARLQLATTKQLDVERRLTNNEGVILRADEIRAALARAVQLDARLAELAPQIASAIAAVTAAEGAVATATAATSELTRRRDAALARADRARSRLADKAVVDAAAAALPALRSAAEVLEGEIGRLDVAIREGQDLVLNSATTRITGLRIGLQSIAGVADEGPSGMASRTLAADDEAEAKAAKAPSLVEQDRARLNGVRADLEAHRREVQQKERVAARAAEIANAEAEAAEASAEAATLASDLAAAREALPTRTEALRVAQVARTALVQESAAVTQERGALQPVAKLVEPLAQAEARLAELAPQKEALATDVAALKEELEQLGDLPENTILPDVAGAKARVESATRDLNATEGAIAVKASQVAEAHASAKRIAALDGERRVVEAEIADWTRIADDLGRDGIQALEIDAAGPELTALVNDLLHTCVGSRWTVSIQASRLSADGKKVLEGCEVSVLDTEKGREGEASTLSGGEGVIVGEAISLALSMLACRRSGVQGPTLVRDETGAALDPSNARAYVAMLRRAAEIVGASRVFFVSHNPEISGLADARIEIGGGKVSVAA